MTDGSHWMRSVHISRPTSPYPESPKTQGEPDGDAARRPEIRPMSSYRSLRPSAVKLSSILPSRRTSPPLKSPRFERETSFEKAVSFKEKDEVYSPDPDQMVNTLTSVAMMAAGKPLPAEYNSFLLHVLEAYRNMKAALDVTRAELQSERDGRHADNEATQEKESGWAAEREIYRAEVKRLELLLVDRTRGMEALVQARKGSLLRRGRAVGGSNDMVNEHSTALMDNSNKRTIEAPRRRKPHRVLSNHDFRMSQLLSSHKSSARLPPGTPPSAERTPGLRAMLDEPSPTKMEALAPVSKPSLPMKFSAPSPDMSPARSYRQQPPELQEDESSTDSSELDWQSRYVPWDTSKI